MIFVDFKKLKNTKAWKLTSEYVRKKAKNRCYTCKRYIPYKKLSAGHFIEKIGAASIYFDLRGLRAQCFYCNRRLHGNKSIYAYNLEKELGHGVIQELVKKSRKTKKWTKEELEVIEKEVIEMIRGLD